jgi:cell division control protein 6
MPSVIENPEPLNPEFSPKQLQHRITVLKQLSQYFNSTGQTIHLHGPQGSGKTAVTQNLAQQIDRTTVTAPCTRYNTEYKALRHISSQLTEQDQGTGHHTSDLIRIIEKQLPHQEPVIILDDIEHLLLNADDSLLYQLSRITNREHLTLITTSHQPITELSLEERTQSSLHPRTESLEPYTAEQTYQILAERARDSLKTRSLRREALTYISATTQNLTAALTWLKTAAENTDNVITENHVQHHRKNAYLQYSKHLLKDYTQHHLLTLQSITQLLDQHNTSTVRSGEVYQQYQSLCETRKIEPLTERQISTHLKQLETLQLIQSQYHYGGSKGKTREITANTF